MAIYNAPESLHVGTGTETVFGFNWPYLLPRDLVVTVNGQAVPTVLASPNQVAVVPAPAALAIVRIYRNTPAQNPTYLFATGIPMLPKYIDGNNKQLLYALQEGLLQFAQTQAAADAALEAARLAQLAAEQAAVSAAQQARDMRRTVRVPTTDPEIPELPTAAARANRVLGFDSLGNPVGVLPVSGSGTELAIQLVDSTVLAHGASMVARSSVTVTSIAELRALSATRKLTAILQAPVIAGSFYYDPRDMRAAVAVDPVGGVYVAPASDLTGASGCWVRQYGQAVMSTAIMVDWFGAGPNNPDVDSAPAYRHAAVVARHLANTHKFGRNDARARVLVGLQSGCNYYHYTQVSLEVQGARIDFGCLSGKVNIIGVHPTAPYERNPLGFSFDLLYDTTFQGINFSGFGVIHEWDTDNLDSALVMYRHCEFNDSGEPGTPVINTRSFLSSRSTDLSFVDCRCNNVPRLLHTYCDTTRFTGGVYRNADPDGALVLADSHVYIEGGMWVPYAVGDKARWFDMYDLNRAGSRGMTVDAVRMSPESGGIPLAYNYMDGSDTVANRFTNGYWIHGGSAAAAPGLLMHTGLIVLASVGGYSVAPSIVAIDASVRSRTGLVRTEAGLPVNKLRGRFAIQISETSQAHLATVGVSPTAPLLEAGLMPYLVGHQLYRAPAIVVGSAAMQLALGAAGPNGTYNITGTGSKVTALLDAFDGEVVRLVFQNASSGVQDVSNGSQIYLSGGADFVTGAFGSITLERQRAGNKWVEVSRSTR